MPGTADDLALLEASLALVADRIGDPAPRVFARMFAAAPELQALFVNDASGTLRAEMFLRALECLLDAAGPRHYGAQLVAAEHANHLGYGVPDALFLQFFDWMIDTFREASGTDWKVPTAAAWARARQAVAAALTPSESSPA